MQINEKSRKTAEDYFIKTQKGNNNIGIELEFPLINLNKEPVSIEIAKGLLEHFLNLGFITVETTTNNEPAFIENKNGDVLSFDNSYNNFEFSMNYGKNLLDIQKRFILLYKEAINYLAPHNYVLAGLGTNPYKKYTKQLHVDFPVYNMVDEYLHSFNCEKTHNYPDFPAYLSSAQTHLDVKVEDLPKTATFFAKIDFARAALFSNSLSFENTLPLCYRDYLWENSAFGLLSDNTGKVCEKFETIDDIVSMYMKKSMFNRIRNGKYEIFEPVLFNDYFKEENSEDINCYLSFKNIEITHRGTLEIRSDCQQNVDYSFVPSSFALGLLENIDEAVRITNEFFTENNIVDNNKELRDKVIWQKALPFSNEKFSEFLKNLVKISENGLKKRNLGEEALLGNIFKRAENLQCPSTETLQKIKNNVGMNEIILSTIPNEERKKYSEFE